jgi:mono/diheme cytochrome c family protein
MGQASNLVQIVLNGGYAPATQGNPRPFGMPPFVLVLNDTDMALVLTHVRQSWGNRASEITPVEVNRIRANSGR